MPRGNVSLHSDSTGCGVVNFGRLIYPLPPARRLGAIRTALPDAMRQFHAGERDGRGAERLESEHRRAAPLYGTMVLLDDVIEVSAAADHHGLQLRFFHP